GIHGDWGTWIQQTTDGGFIVTGYMYNDYYSDYDIFLMKTNLYGDSTWTKRFRGINGGGGECVQQTTDGGFIVGGYTDTGSGYSGYIIKTDSIGDTLWTKLSATGYVTCVRQTVDGGYILTGSSVVYLLKTDTLGNQIWYQSYGGNGGYSVQKTSDGGYIVVGKIGSGNLDILMVKTDSLGNEQWSNIYGGSDREIPYSVYQTFDKGYIVVGETESYGAGLSDVYVIKTDANGDTLWTNTYGGVRLRYSKETLDEIWRRTQGRCHICGKKLHRKYYGEEWHVDHSKPRAKGGTNHFNNYFPACSRCNSLK
ncbi:unnamed protein product, partial [marine sediment metagenome]